MNYQIPENVLVALIKYLDEKPHREVAQLIAVLKRLEPCEKVEDPKNQSDEG